MTNEEYYARCEADRWETDRQIPYAYKATDDRTWRKDDTPQLTRLVFTRQPCIYIYNPATDSYNWVAV
jgi:hypothetical protein